MANLKINWINAGGDYEHVNHARKFAQQQGKFGVADLRDNSKDHHENYASMRDLIGFDSNAGYVALYTSIGAPISIYKDAPIKNVVYLSSNKHNACPLVIARCRGKYVLWHIAFSDMVNLLKADKSMRDVFPKFLLEVQKQVPEYSLMSVFDDSDAEFLVTNTELMSQEALGVKGKIGRLDLPADPEPGAGASPEAARDLPCGVGGDHFEGPGEGTQAPLRQHGGACSGTAALPRGSPHPHPTTRPRDRCACTHAPGTIHESSRAAFMSPPRWAQGRLGMASTRRRSSPCGATMSSRGGRPRRSQPTPRGRHGR